MIRGRVLSTRMGADGLPRRKRVVESGMSFVTVEVPLEVWTALNKTGRGNDRMAGWLRKVASDNLRKQAIEMFKQGITKRWYIADKLGVPDRTVGHWLIDYQRTGKTGDAR